MPRATTFQQLPHRVPVLAAVVEIHHVIDQEGAGGADILDHIQCGAMLVGAVAATGMPACEGAPQLLQMAVVGQFRCMAAGAPKHRKGEVITVKQAGAVLRDGGDHRQVALREEQAEGMLLKDLFVAPALWAIELHNHRGTVFLADLINPVLETVQLQ